MSDQDNSTYATRSGPEERDYLSRRANDHRELAERCDEQGPRLIHQRLQQLYEEQASSIRIVLPD